VRKFDFVRTHRSKNNEANIWRTHGWGYSTWLECSEISTLGNVAVRSARRFVSDIQYFPSEVHRPHSCSSSEFRRGLRSLTAFHYCCNKVIGMV